MMYLISIFIVVLVSASFVGLTVFESRKGVRYLARQRDVLDQIIEHISFVVSRVDFSAWLQAEVRGLVDRTSHGIVHLTLQGIRMVERFLTRVIKYLRTKEGAQDAPKATERPFIGTLADFKTQLSATRPEMSEMTKMG